MVTKIARSLHAVRARVAPLVAISGELDLKNGWAQLANARYAPESLSPGNGQSSRRHRDAETLTVLTTLAEVRAAGVPDGYERLKEFTRGRVIDARALGEFIDGLPLPATERARLRALKPVDYVGLAAALARGV